MKVNLNFLCIPNNVLLKIFFVNINKNFYKKIVSNYKNFLIKDNEIKYKNKIFVNVLNKTDFKCVSKIFYKRKDFGLCIENNNIYCFVEENIYSFDSMMRIIFSYVLFLNKGLLLHSSGIVYKKNCYLFIGKSGKGKSTIIKNIRSKKIKILSDELVSLIFFNKKLFSYKSPFWGELGRQKKMLRLENTNRIFEVRKIFVLNKHTNFFKIIKCNYMERTKHLLKNNLCVLKSNLLGGKVLSTVVNIVKKDMFYKLNFNKNFLVEKII